MGEGESSANHITVDKMLTIVRLRFLNVGTQVPH